VERWWHLYQASCAHAMAQITAGGSPIHPEQLVAEHGLTLSEPMSTCCGHDCLAQASYVRSWNHEPSEAEVAAVTPELD
jgi:hypothetical protein